MCMHSICIEKLQEWTFHYYNHNYHIATITTNIIIYWNYFVCIAFFYIFAMWFFHNSIRFKVNEYWQNVVMIFCQSFFESITLKPSVFLIMHPSSSIITMRILQVRYLISRWYYFHTKYKLHKYSFIDCYFLTLLSQRVTIQPKSNSFAHIQ